MSLVRGLLEIVAPMAAACAAYHEERCWLTHGFARFEDHCRESFHRSGRWLRDMALLGRTFAEHLDLRLAFDGSDGQPPLGRCRAVLIARVATKHTLRDWIRAARRCSVAELRELVRRARSDRSHGPPGEPAAGGGASSTSSPASVNEAMAGRNDREKDRPLAPGEEPDAEERSRVTLHVPLPVAAAFDEGLELYRAVEGSDASVSDFIEALSAEESSGGALEEGGPAEGCGRSPLETGESIARRERELARRTGQWSSLPRHGDAPSPLDLAEWTLARVKALLRGSLDGRAAAVTSQILSMVQLENQMEIRLADLLLLMSESGAWPRLGFTCAGHYAEQRLGMSRTWAEDRVRAARALRRHARLRRAYHEGSIGLEAVLRITRLLKHAPEAASATGSSRDLEGEWLERALGCTVKRLRDEARELLRRRALLLSPRRRGVPGQAPLAPLDDLGWFRSLARRAGTARLRIAILGGLAVERPEADTRIVLRLTDDLAEMFIQALGSALHRTLASAEASRAAGASGTAEVSRAAAPGETAGAAEGGAGRPLPSQAAARTFSDRGRAVPSWVGLLAMLEGFAATWDNDDDAPDREFEDVLIAFGWRCAAPGCTSRRMLQVHHVVYRSHGGGDERENLVILCLFHHLRGQHGGLMACQGKSPLGVTWRLGEKQHGVFYRNERLIEPRRAPAPLRPVVRIRGAAGQSSRLLH